MQSIAETPDQALPSQSLEIFDSSANRDRKLRVLAAEDNPVFQTVLRSLLTKWGYDAILVRNGLEAWQELQSPNGPQMAILDWMMPGLDGLEVCRRVRSELREPYIYIVLLTARTDPQDLVEGMEAGADDYLTKPFNAHQLRLRLRAGRRIIDLQEQLLVTREALRVQATHDGLTTLLNRMAILEVLRKELSRAKREPQPVSVLMIDLDHFKQINDTCGHMAGDAVLCEMARRMQAAVRAYDTVGRYGGEEFLIVLPGCSTSDASAQAERVRQAVGGTPFRAGEKLLQVTCSIGVSSRSHPAELDSDGLIRDADRALYQAKDAGRNRVVADLVDGRGAIR